ncbi:MAG: hypothetical protein R3D00_24390 [Bacteroidia bacterium]
MKKELIAELFKKFEEACYDLEGLECWSAREMQEILVYKDWRNFLNTVNKASKSCENSGESIPDHFVGITKMVRIGSGTDRIPKEHIDNNKEVRSILLRRGVNPENLPAAEDVKKVQRRIESTEKKILKDIKKDKK